MADLTKVYYDASGMFRKVVFVTNGPANYNHALHDEPGLTGIVLPRAVYQNTAPAVAMNGVAYPMSLNAAVAAFIAITNPTLSALLLSNNANADAITAAFAAAAVPIGP